MNVKGITCVSREKGDGKTLKHWVNSMLEKTNGESSSLADFPKDQQLAAAQAAVLLLPDENREALRTLLLFLRDVVACVDENQMTPTNIAVCLAPSLFHLNTLRKDADAHRWAARPGGGGEGIILREVELVFEST